MNELDDYQMPESYGTTIGKCLTFAEIEGLLAAERERCAAVAGNEADWIGFWDGQPIRLAIAAAIRNLPPQTEGVVGPTIPPRKGMPARPGPHSAKSIRLGRTPRCKASQL